MRLFHILILLGLTLLQVVPQAAPSREQQRRDFLAAEKALNAGDLATFDRLQQALADYPLHPYLGYQALRRELDKTDTKTVDAFLSRYAEQPVAGLLRNNWLRQLTRQGRWSEYLRYFDGSDSIRGHCDYLSALIKTGQKEKAYPEVDRLWLYGRSRPDACDFVFDSWRADGNLDTPLVWQRIYLAMNRNQSSLARYLQRFLPAEEQAWLDRWLILHRKPQRATEPDLLKGEHPYKPDILVHAIKRLARDDILAAIELWNQLKQQHAFDPLRTLLAERSLALAAMRSEDPEVYQFLAQVHPCSHDVTLQEARLRAALLHRDWDNLLGWLGRLPAKERLSARWRYWRARGLAESGDPQKADQLFRSLAGERNYYGFLAADRLELPYAMQAANTPVSADAITRMAGHPGIERAVEFRALERHIEARREWRQATDNLSNEELMAAAEYAQSIGWHDQAIFTLARTEHWDDLELRFPLEHEDHVDQAVSSHQLDEAWIYAVMRQESAFMADARSHAGARGLMQLMPATARRVAKQHYKQRLRNSDRLYDPALNIRLGTTYLQTLSKELDDNPMLATAAYNAGPHRVRQWLPEQQLDAEIWVELIPFRETRRYVRRVMSYSAIYGHRLGLPLSRISERMHPVPDAATLSTRQNSKREKG